MSLVRSAAEIKQMYLERSDSLDASSYEVPDLCDEIERLRADTGRLDYMQAECIHTVKGTNAPMWRIEAECEGQWSLRDAIDAAMDGGAE
jgi:hypothetical protein